jgi:hypothetical protein
MPIIVGGSDSGTVSYYEGLIAAKWGVSAGDAYAAYAAAHPALTPEEAANDYIEIILAESLGNALSAGITGGANVEGAAATGIAKGGIQAVADLSPTNILNKLWGILSSRGTWIRLAEGVIGGALILVAVAELGKGTAIGSAVKKVPFI